ncbi:unnamed protein product, partial [Meganyctiphanes norvegica]
IIYIPMAFLKVVVPSTAEGGEGSVSLYMPKENREVVEMKWFIVYEYLLEICVRFAPALMLAVLNTWIIIEFKRLSKRRRLMSSQGMANEVSCYPSYSHVDANTTTVINSSKPGTADAKNTPLSKSQNNINGTANTLAVPFNSHCNESKSLGNSNTAFIGEADIGNGVSSDLNQSSTQLQNEKISKSSSNNPNKSNKSDKSSKISSPKPKTTGGMSERRHD